MGNIVTKNKTKFSPWDLIILVLSLYVLIELSLEIILTIPLKTLSILSTIDLFICIIFLFDWIYFFIRSESKSTYFKIRLIDLIASIPFANILRVFRIFRVFRLIKILRIVRSVKTIRPITKFFLGNPARSALSIYLGLTAVVFFYSALGIYNFERGINPNIHNFGDSIWLCFTSITSVGYGDIYPVTSEGRIFAAILVITGMGLFGLVTAEIATVFIKQFRNKK